jgi:predicted metalloprotease
MKWRMGRRSSNVSDQRGAGGGLGGGLGGLGGGLGRGGGMGGGILSLLFSRLGFKGILILVVIFFALKFMGIDPLALLAGGGGLTRDSEVFSESQSGTTGVTPTGNVTEDELADFTAVILGSTEDTWRDIFAASGTTYRDPVLVMFDGSVQSACGYAQSAMGPFYCPADSKVYIDLDFYRDLAQRFGAPGDFAQAYVIAHEVGHHIQNLIGVEEQTRRERQRLSEADANALSVRVELQADCFAGIWAHHLSVKNQELQLEEGDIDEALTAASAIGDDRLQQQSSGRIVPDSFTHGSSEQRMRWFKNGFDTGNPEACDTFKANQL